MHANRVRFDIEDDEVIMHRVLHCKVAYDYDRA